MSKKIYLLKTYLEYSANSIIEVSNEIAEELVNNGIARYTLSRDYLVKPRFIKKIITRAFRKSPSIK